MKLFYYAKNEKKEIKDVVKHQDYLEKVLKKSFFLFESQDDWYDKDDYYHYFSMQYYLTPQNNLISKKTTGYRDGHNALYGSSLVFRQFISFAELNEAIEKGESAEAKSFKGITEDNCREYMVNKIKNELVKIEKKRLRKIYPDNDAWRSPKNIADSMGNVGCARILLDHYTDKLAKMSYKEIEKEYAKLKRR